MAAPVVVVGHRNPDNDSICASVAYAHLKNELEKKKLEHDPDYQVLRYVATRLGPLPPESEWVLKKYGFEIPKVVSHVYARVVDVMTAQPYSISQNATLLDAGRALRKHNVRALVVLNDAGKYLGLITTRMLAERYISATDVLAEGGANSMAVAADLIASLEQKVEEITETDVLVLDKEGLLKDAVEDLMETTLREAVVLDDEDQCIGIVTRSDVTTVPRRKVILVDHNETRQAVSGIEEAEVIEILDHHRIGDIVTSNPIPFINLPVGSTATIVTMEYRKHGIEPSAGVAALLLSAIMTDTVVLKSPTTTSTDHDQAHYLARIAQVDPVEFGLDVFKCRGNEDDVPIDKLVAADAKEFQMGDAIALISQYETIDLASVMERESEIRSYMRALIENKGYEFVLLMATDIMAEGSQFLCEGNRRIVNRVFNIKCTGSGGTWMPGVLSRKKQVASRILGA